MVVTLKILCFTFICSLMIITCLMLYYMKQSNYYRDACDKEYKEKLKYRNQRDQALNKIESKDRLIDMYESHLKG